VEWLEATRKKTNLFLYLSIKRFNCQSLLPSSASSLHDKTPVVTPSEHVLDGNQKTALNFSDREKPNRTTPGELQRPSPSGFAQRFSWQWRKDYMFMEIFPSTLLSSLNFRNILYGNTMRGVEESYDWVEKMELNEK